MRRKLAILLLGLLLTVGLTAVPVSAATENDAAPVDQATCEHDFSEWEVTEPAENFAVGLKVRECADCGLEQTARVYSPLMIVAACAIGLVLIILLTALFVKIAEPVWKVIKRIIFWIFVVFILLLLFGAVAKTVMDGRGFTGAAFAANLVSGVVSLIAGKGFYTTTVAECIYNMFGHYGAIGMNGLFYLLTLGLIASIISGCRRLVRKTREVGKLAKDKAVELKDAVADVFTGSKDKNDQ